LHWAALRGDIPSVRTLLSAGANPKRQDLEGRTALLAAVQSGNVRCVEILLIARGDVHTRDAAGHDALQTAAWAKDDQLLLETILLGGAYINSSGYSGGTALQSAACLNHVRNGAYLLEMGADPEIRDINGDTPLFEVVRYDCKEFLELLIRHGVRYGNVNKLGFTVLHVAALYSSIETMDILVSAQMQGVDLLAMDLKGRTAEETFQYRVGFSEGLRVSFERLLNSVNRDPGDNEDGDTDAFVDALEDLGLEED
jgi:ankyrin repeat protein